MSGGGRHGFEAPYFPMGCHYRWYSTPEICMILERFDAIVFVGDDMLKHIYSAFNMLLRENIAIGGLQQWELTENERAGCKCDNQILRSECSLHSVMDSPAVNENEQISSHKSPYHCPSTFARYQPFLYRSDHNTRNTPPLHSHKLLTRTGRPDYEVHQPPSQPRRLLQTHPRHPHPLPLDLPLLARRHSLNG